MDQKYDYFISYKAQDVLLVRQIAELMMASGISVWFDEYQILFNNYEDDKLEMELMTAIENATYGIIFTNDLYFNSKYCSDELKLLLKKPKSNIINILLQPHVLFRNFDDLRDCPTWTGASKVNEICSFINARTNIQIVDTSQTTERDSQIYKKKYLHVPYQLNISGWQESSWPLFSKITNTASSTKLGPWLKRTINDYQLEVNVCMGPELHPAQISSQVHHTTDHREIQKNLMRPRVQKFLTDFGPDTIIGFHLLPHREYMHHAFTYKFSENKWQRKYSITLPQPNCDELYDFVFTCNFDGPFEEFCRIAHLLDSLVVSLEWPPLDRNEAIYLNNVAFYAVEQENSDFAIILLNQAIKQNPKLGHAYNELAYIYNKIKQDPEVAEKYAQIAVQCDPANPKFHNALSGIQLARMKKLSSKTEILDKVRKHLEQIEESLRLSPGNPSSYLSKALFFALSGKAPAIWEEQLNKAEKLYLRQLKEGTPKGLECSHIKTIIHSNKEECQNLNDHWEKLPT